jgi:hypothetical protein
MNFRFPMFTTLGTLYLTYISLPVYCADNRLFYKHAASKDSSEISSMAHCSEANPKSMFRRQFFSIVNKTKQRIRILHAPALQKGQANVTSNFGRCFLGVGLELDLRFPIMRPAHVYNLKYKASIIRLPIQ